MPSVCSSLNDLAKTNNNMSPVRVAVIGGGLVGSLVACILGQKGLQVDLYEYRPDIRGLEHVPGRSINLAMSERGRQALRIIGLEETMIKEHGIPMYGRMIHGIDGSTNDIPYGKEGQFICSVGRRHLNEVLLTAAEKNPNVQIHFEHKLWSADLDQGLMTFVLADGSEMIGHSDVILGADGAHSAVRRELMKRPGFNYSQSYIQHGYVELCIPANEQGKFAMPANYLHIWPRDSFMMIALPNQDNTWTVTMFMPLQQFSELSTPELLLDFFREYFPDSIELIGEDRLVKDYFNTKPSLLMTVKCNPYHVGGRALVIGDAAHAMVPFYGQGMNAGFEDCIILDSLLQQYNSDWHKVLPEFTRVRNPDAEAICDLALKNYIEMRHLVNSRTFMIRKKLDNFIYRIFPNSWIPLYTMVTFSRTRYHECIKNRQWQDRVLRRALLAVGLTTLLSAYFFWAVLTSRPTNQSLLSSILSLPIISRFTTN